MSKPDNNIHRVVERARRYGFTPLYWRATHAVTGQMTYVDDVDLPAFERENNVGLTWMFTPVFNPDEVDYNGFPKNGFASTQNNNNNDTGDNNA